MVKHVPQADEKSASMGWFFDPGFIQNVQRVAADIENPSMESIDSVLFALREMGYIKIAPYRGEDMIGDDGFGTTEHAMRELQAENAALLARHNALRESIHKAMERTADCDKKQTDDQLIADVAYLKRLASDHFKTSVDCGNRAFKVEQKYDALREAVEWERECIIQLDCVGKFWEDNNIPGRELIMILDAARAEVDRLLNAEAEWEGEK